MADVDIATLGIKVDASGADKAEDQLEKLAKSGDNASKSAKGVTSATSQMDATIRAAIAAIQSNTQAMSTLTNGYNQNKGAASGAAKAADDMASRAAKLRAIVDPLGGAIDKVNAELAEARMLYEAGAMSAEDYARAQQVLNMRAADFGRRQAANNNLMIAGTRSTQLQAHEALNLSRQFADIGVTAAMGMNPLMIAVQQGPQILDIMKSSGLGWREMGREMLLFLKILEVVPATNTAAAASNTALAASATAAAVAEQRLGVALGETTAAAAANATATSAAATANAANAASTANAGAMVTRMGPLLRVGGPLVLGLAAIAAGFAFVANEAEIGLGDVQKEFGFTEDQMKRLKEEGVETGYTIGDVMTAAAQTTSNVFREEIDAVTRYFDKLGIDITKSIGGAVRTIIINFIAALKTIKEEWNTLPDAIGASVWETVRRAKEGMNELFSIRNEESGKRYTLFDVPSAKDNPYDTGAAKGMSDAFQRNQAEVARQFGGNMEDARESRLREAAGEPGNSRQTRARKPRQSEEEKDWERALEGAQEYIKSLQAATSEIGKNQFEVKRLNTEREIGDLTAAANAVGTAAAMEKATALTTEMRLETEKWVMAMNAEAIFKLKEALYDEAEALRFESSMIGMNAEERARAMKQREIDLRIQELERDGHYGVAAAIKAESDALVNLAGDRAAYTDRADEANRVATAHRDMAEAIRDATSSFGELFGTAGEGYSNLMQTIFDFQASQAEGQERLIDLERQRAEGTISNADYEFEVGRQRQQMQQEQIAVYGDMLGAAKTFFKEGSAGWRILEAAERAYRLFQFAMQIKSMLMDKVETTSSVANSGARAAADGVAAVAKAIASLPFPLNIAAGAATLAFLVAIGVKMTKGGGGASKSASATANKAVDSYSGPRDNYGNPTSAYSVLRPGATTVAGDPSQAVWGAGGAPAAVPAGGGSFRGGDLIINGGADKRTAEEMQQQFALWSQQTVQDARQAAAQDRAAAANRQYIGG